MRSADFQRNHARVIDCAQFILRITALAVMRSDISSVDQVTAVSVVRVGIVRPERA
jgi:hypothetical protein